MKRNRKWSRRIWLVPIFTGIIMAILLFYFTTIRQTMYEESSGHLNEVSQQMSASIEKQSEARWNMVDMFYRYFMDVADGNWETFDAYAKTKKNDWGFESLCLVDENGIYYDKKNKVSLLSQKEIFKELLTEQKPVILDNVLFGDENRLIFLSPVEGLEINGKTYRAMGAAYHTQNLFDILQIEAFSGKACLYITHEDGVVLFRSECERSIAGYNLFNSLEEAEFKRGSVQELKEHVRSGEKEMMTLKQNGTEYYMNHTSVGVDDWQLVMIVPTSVVSGRMQQSSLLTFVCLLLISGIILLEFVLIYVDSAKKVLRAEAESRKAAESANLAKSQFLSNMSHDIRTPMNAIIGMTKIASDHMGEPEKVKDCLQKIDLSGRLLVGLINDILDMSKIESGKMVLNNNTASLVELMKNIVSITQPTIRQKRQNFNIRLHKIKHEILEFDSLRLNQVLINLLGNAMKFTPEGGSISIDVSEQSTSRPGYAHYTFCVADTGIGMSPEFMEHLFTSFTRERDGRVDKIEGSGLGMAITKMIVTMMEGTIQVKSEVDKGSVFTVDLDLCIAGEPEDMVLPDMRILVADDDPDTCQAAAEFLLELGARAEVAVSGRTAAEMAAKAHDRKEDYQMILLDWRMPDMNGVETARAIRKYVGPEVPILVISAYDWSSIEMEAFEVGIDGFIQKPFFKSTLYRCACKYVLRCESKTELKAQESYDLSGKRILLAEDNEINRQIAVEILMGQGAEVETAVDGREALEIFRRSETGHYDLILMDIQMPHMNGYETTKAIRKLNRADAGKIPIFAMTADAFAEDIEAARKAGMNSHLAKPLDVPMMLREIRKYILS